MSDYEDADLQILSARIILWYCNYRHTPKLVAQVLNMLLEPLKSTNVDNVIDLMSIDDNRTDDSVSWHIKSKILPMLQIFFFRNLFVIDEKYVQKIMDVICGLLADPQIEIRQLAAVTLSGLIRCSQREAIDNLKSRFEFQLKQFKLPKRNRGIAKQDSPSPKDKLQSATYANILVKRHAATLGLSALVQAFPYEVPQWMPEVLELLHSCMTDPTPIKTAAEKAFADFKRTHQDTWHEQQSLFTEDQRYMMSNVLTYNYFA
ncbi:hypothetical protein HK096_000052 [Nowakowskiella sp. JEL0078]|nr:hypothetical protein HK096_000052 [Nowakowskiella sp. JEL0078]